LRTHQRHNMKKALLFIFCFACTPICLLAKNEIDSLLKVLDKTITQAERQIVTADKEAKIKELKLKINKKSSLTEQYETYDKIISEYESFICDSATAYIYKNLAIAEKLNSKDHIYSVKLRLALVLSISGLFTQAHEILETIEFDDLPAYLKPGCCWTYIRYYENLMRYTDNPDLCEKYLSERDKYRDLALATLPEQSDEYLKEKAFRLQEVGEYKEACEILTEIYLKQKPYTHGYAMSAMSLASTYQMLQDSYSQERFLILAAITDTKLAVKENEALLALALYLYDKGDINRAYNYIKVALDDANFYNSRFRNTVIARVQPIIEETYLFRIEQQKQNLRNYSILTSLFVIVLVIALYFIYRQIRIVSRARKKLRIVNEQLAGVNQKLDEANLIKEGYIGYFMNQCAVYIDKLDDYRKNVNRKIKAGQIDDLYKLTSSTRNLEKEVEELYHNFDKAFFKIYPNFVEEFNALLREDERYKLQKDQLNTELRIFALIRLGITDVNQIAVFLRYSLQTIYNYKSKVKGKAIINSDHFEEEVKKIGAFS